MTTLNWLNGLPGPQVSSFSTSEVVGFKESPLAAGPAFIEVFSEDTPQFHNVTYLFKSGDARRFKMWLRANKFKSHSPWFNGPIITEDRSVETQVCRYTAEGFPQFKGVTIGGLHSYSAKLLTREIVNNDDDYAESIDAMWYANNGDIDNGASLLDEGLNG